MSEPTAAERPSSGRPVPVSAAVTQDAKLWREPQDPAPALPGSVPQELGKLGTVAPQPAHVIHADAPLHEDDEGRAQHALIDLTSAPGQGFAAVWRDTRDGNAGLYFGRLDPSGEPREAERPLYSQCSSGREMEPSIALSPDGVGGFTWYSSGTADQQVNLRFFSPRGELQPIETRFGARGDKLGRGRPSALPAQEPGAEATQGRAARASHRLPTMTLVSVPENDAGATKVIGALVWAEEGRILFQWLDRGGAGVGEPQALNERDPLATGAPRMATGKDGSIVCVWPAARSIQAIHVEQRPQAGAVIERKKSSAGDGEPLELLADPQGGFWLTVRERERLCVRHLSDEGKPDADEIVIPGDPKAGFDVATIARGLVLLVQKPAEVPVLLLMERSGGILERMPVPIAEVSGPVLPGARIASDGERLLVVWSEERRGASDVYYRLFDAGLAGGEVRRWNKDEKSADQLHPDVDARDGAVAIAAWADGRSGTQRIRARRLAADGTPQGGEIELPVSVAKDSDLPPESSALRPAVALGVDGGFLVAWVASVGGREELRLQAFDPNGSPLGPARLGDTEGAPLAPFDATGLADGRYVVAFGRRDSGLQVRAFDRTGSPLMDPLRLSKHPVAGRPTLAQIDRERLVVCWDITMPEGNHAVRAHFLTSELRPDGDEIDFPLSYAGDDWDPTVARGPDGGFVLAWTVGQGHGRDIFVGFFDRHGKPAGAPLPVTSRLNEQDWPALIQTAANEWVVAWEDDISHLDHTYVRRVTQAGLGPIVTLNEREALFNQNRGAPRIAPVAGGIIAVFSDVRRSRGHDAYYKVIGRDFDRFD